jgi:hypothetical protein
MPSQQEFCHTLPVSPKSAAAEIQFGEKIPVSYALTAREPCHDSISAFGEEKRCERRQE